MQYQLLHEYNRTAQNDNKTSPETLELTRAWDHLQTQVMTPDTQRHQFIHSFTFIYCTRKSVQYKHTIQTEVQIQQEQAKADRAYRRPVPKFSC